MAVLCGGEGLTLVSVFIAPLARLAWTLHRYHGGSQALAGCRLQHHNCCRPSLRAAQLQHKTGLQLCRLPAVPAVTLIIAEQYSEDCHLLYGLIKMPIYIQYIGFFMMLTIFIIKTELQIAALTFGLHFLVRTDRAPRQSPGPSQYPRSKA